MLLQWEFILSGDLAGLTCCFSPPQFPEAAEAEEAAGGRAPEGGGPPAGSCRRTGDCSVYGGQRDTACMFQLKLPEINM